MPQCRSPGFTPHQHRIPETSVLVTGRREGREGAPAHGEPRKACFVLGSRRDASGSGCEPVTRWAARPARPSGHTAAQGLSSSSPSRSKCGDTPARSRSTALGAGEDTDWGRGSPAPGGPCPPTAGRKRLIGAYRGAPWAVEPVTFPHSRPRPLSLSRPAQKLTESARCQEAPFRNLGVLLFPQRQHVGVWGHPLSCRPSRWTSSGGGGTPVPGHS